MNHDTVHFSRMPSPAGVLLIVADATGLRSIFTPSHKGFREPLAHWREDDAALRPARDQLAAYFRGELQRFSLPLHPQGTPFQLRVWKLLLEIPYGETTSYGELARKLGSPSACRAVGLANGKNPISFVIPCHRVIGKDGSLTGYGGGLEMKRRLLSMEAPTVTPWGNSRQLTGLPR